jgi:AcrR family transcriptional regulator
MGLARDGGPQAVVLREAARRVGVSATAAYRHFANHGALIRTVRQRAQDALDERMRAELRSAPPATDPVEEGPRRLRAFGHAYVRFALTEPGLFRTAFCHPDSGGPPDFTEFPPYRALCEALDEMAGHGLLGAGRRVQAEVVCWAAVHGLAVLLLDGPLRVLGPDERDAAVARTIEAVLASLSV